MDWITPQNAIQLLAILVPILTAVWVARERRIKHPADEVATSASTIDTMMNTIKSLTEELDTERERRREQIEELEGMIIKSTNECAEHIEKLRKEHGEELSRMRQAHNDRVNSLKARIRTLEQEAV